MNQGVIPFLCLHRLKKHINTFLILIIKNKNSLYLCLNMMLLVFLELLQVGYNRLSLILWSE